MNVDKAIDVFGKILDSLSSDEIKKHVEKFDSKNYSGITLDQMLNYDCEEGISHSFSFTNQGWFTLNMEYLEYVNNFNLSTFTHSDSLSMLIQDFASLNCHFIDVTDFTFSESGESPPIKENNFLNGKTASQNVNCEVFF